MSNCYNDSLSIHLSLSRFLMGVILTLSNSNYRLFMISWWFIILLRCLRPWPFLLNTDLGFLKLGKFSSASIHLLARCFAWTFFLNFVLQISASLVDRYAVKIGKHVSITSCGGDRPSRPWALLWHLALDQNIWCYRRTPLCKICIPNYDILLGCPRLAMQLVVLAMFDVVVYPLASYLVVHFLEI